MFRKLLAVVLAAAAFNVLAAVDANRATQAELETVKGIGPGLSSKIVKAREMGAFKSWADFVERVGGVGPGNAARFSQAGLTVGGSPLDASSLPAPTKGGAKVAAEAGERTAKGSRTERTEGKAAKTEPGDTGTRRATKPAAEGKAPQA
jgi:competence protein ComEA